MKAPIVSNENIPTQKTSSIDGITSWLKYYIEHFDMLNDWTPNNKY
jgi:hypothetical protein